MFWNDTPITPYLSRNVYRLFDTYMSASPFEYVFSYRILNDWVNTSPINTTFESIFHFRMDHIVSYFPSAESLLEIDENNLPILDEYYRFLRIVYILKIVSHSISSVKIGSIN
jgi:hypothetical protein